MRAWWAASSIAVGCSFSAPAAVPDGTVDVPQVPDANTDAVQTRRVDAGLIGLWLMDEGGGLTVSDTTGAFVLKIADGNKVSWSPEGLMVTGPVDITSDGTQNQLVTKCKAANAVSLEAWVTPSDLMQTGTQPGQPARVFTFTVKNIGGHLISLGQAGGTWGGQVLTSATALTDTHGGPMLTTGLVALAPTHLVITATATERRFFVNGMGVSDALGGTFDNWSATFFNAMAGDPGKRDPWLGTIHLVAVYDRALTYNEVMTNYLAGY